MTIRVLVVDDQEILRNAIADFVAGEGDLEVVAVGCDGREGVELAEATTPDVALVDVRMPGGGPAAVRGIAAISPATRVLALSAYEDLATMVDMLHAGAVGYVVKGASPHEIATAIRQAAANQASLSAPALAGMIDALVRDQAEARLALDVLRRSEARFRDLLESAPDAAVIVDARGDIVLVNRQTETLFGYRREELVGRSVDILIPERVRELHAAHRAGYLVEPQTRPMGAGLELAGRRKDGTEVGVDISLATLDTDEGLFTTAFVRPLELHGTAPLDLTRTERQSDAGALAARLVTAQAEDRRRVADRIHDDSIQAMTATSMRLQILRRQLDEDESLTLLDELEGAIRLAVSSLRRLVSELQPPDLEEQGLGARLEAYLADEQRLTTTRLVLEDELASPPHTEIGLLLYRVAQEAIANAVQAGAATAAVRLSDRAAGHAVTITAAGVGLAHERLGLLRELAVLLGGRVEVRSAAGEGTTVECWLPKV